MRVWNMNCDWDDECDVRVYIPGPPGPPLVDVGSYLHPVDISAGTIAAPVKSKTTLFHISGERTREPTCDT